MLHRHLHNAESQSACMQVDFSFPDVIVCCFLWSCCTCTSCWSSSFHQCFSHLPSTKSPLDLRETAALTGHSAPAHSLLGEHIHDQEPQAGAPPPRPLWPYFTEFKPIVEAASQGCFTTSLLLKFMQCSAAAWLPLSVPTQLYSRQLGVASSHYGCCSC